MKITPNEIGDQIKRLRKVMRVTQKDLALTSGTGLRFIIDLEKGKSTCQLGKTLSVLHTLGLKINLESPVMDCDALSGEGRGSESGKGEETGSGISQ